MCQCSHVQHRPQPIIPDACSWVVSIPNLLSFVHSHAHMLKIKLSSFHSLIFIYLNKCQLLGRKIQDSLSFSIFLISLLIHQLILLYLPPIRSFTGSCKRFMQIINISFPVGLSISTWPIAQFSLRMRSFQFVFYVLESQKDRPTKI